jgi:hypothetical protein
VVPRAVIFLHVLACSDIVLDSYESTIEQCLMSAFTGTDQVATRDKIRVNCTPL